MGLTLRDYQQALDSQYACNLSGIIKSWSEILMHIWDEAREHEGGTDWVNRHPINRLFVEQAAHLIGAGTPHNSDGYYSAYNAVLEKKNKMEQK